MLFNRNDVFITNDYERLRITISNEGVYCKCLKIKIFSNWGIKTWIFACAYWNDKTYAF